MADQEVSLKVSVYQGVKIPQNAFRETGVITD